MKTAIKQYSGKKIIATLDDSDNVTITMKRIQLLGLANQCRFWYNRPEANENGRQGWSGASSEQGVVFDALLGVITSEQAEENGVTLYDGPTNAIIASPAASQEATAPRIRKKYAKLSLQVGFSYLDSTGKRSIVVQERSNAGPFCYKVIDSDGCSWNYSGTGQFAIAGASPYDLILSTAKRVKEAS